MGATKTNGRNLSRIELRIYEPKAYIHVLKPLLIIKSIRGIEKEKEGGSRKTLQLLPPYIPIVFTH